MESLKTISSIKIPTNKIFYNKKTNVFSAEILNFMFVGTYKKSTRVKKILDDIFASFKGIDIKREEIYFVDFVTGTEIPERTKLKELKLFKKKKVKKKEEKLKVKRDLKDVDKPEIHEMEEKEIYSEDVKELLSISEDRKYKEEAYDEEKSVKEEEEPRRETDRIIEKQKAKKKSRELESLSPPGSGPPPSPAKVSAPAAPPPPPSDALAGLGSPPEKPIPAPSTIISEEPPTKVYEINMGLQYYSVMMEQRSYLFYVYFSHKELKIVDEEGKTIYETTFKIVTTKEEPPILDLKIEGEGFEVHPLFGKIEVKKDAVNPPVMIFSIMPTKTKKKNKKKKEIERRYLNVYIEFEDKVISHTILSIIVQPKYFQLKIGPLRLNLSKGTAAIISFVSILVAGISLIWTLFSWDPSSSFIDVLSGFAPGLGSIAFIAIFLITLFKEGIYPLKEKINAFLNFDQEGILIK
jgi:hypothetical protein